MSVTLNDATYPIESYESVEWNGRELNVSFHRMLESLLPTCFVISIVVTITSRGIV